MTLTDQEVAYLKAHINNNLPTIYGMPLINFILSKEQEQQTKEQEQEQSPE